MLRLKHAQPATQRKGQKFLRCGNFRFGVELGETLRLNRAGPRDPSNRKPGTGSTERALWSNGQVCLSILRNMLETL